LTKFVVNWLAIVIAVVIAAQLMPAQIIWDHSNYQGLAIFALVLGLLNAFVAPIVKILTFPITLLTLGLFSIVVNAAFFMLAASLSGGNVKVTDFLSAMIAALIVSVVSMFVSRVL
jgi:putative membrane protein